MQSLVVFLTAAVKAAWPLLQPVVLQVAKNLATELITKAKTNSLSPNLAFLAGPLADVEADLLKLLSPQS